MKLEHPDKACLELAAQQSLSNSGRVFVDAVVAMGSDCDHVTLLRLKIVPNYSHTSTVAVFENGKRV